MKRLEAGRLLGAREEGEVERSHVTRKLRWQKSDGEGSQAKAPEKTRESALKFGVLRTSLWERKGYLLSLTPLIRIRDNQE